MPNLRGGKAYKKTKGREETVQYLNKEPDQMVGRVIRNLGDLNMSVFCEDNKSRICKIASGLKKTVRIQLDDLVLVSLRDCLLSAADSKRGVRSDRGDIIGKYNILQYPELKKAGTNSHLFIDGNTVRLVAEKYDDGDEKAVEGIVNAADGTDIFDMTAATEEGEEEKKDLDDKDIDAI